MEVQIVCLVCGKQAPKMVGLWNNDEEAATVFNLLTDIQIRENDFVCRSCNNQLQIVCEFREKCHTSELILMRQLGQQQEVTKEEVTEEAAEEEVEPEKPEEVEMIEEWVEHSDPPCTQMVDDEEQFIEPMAEEEATESERSYTSMNLRELLKRQCPRNLKRIKTMKLRKQQKVGMSAQSAIKHIKEQIASETT